MKRPLFWVGIMFALGEAISKISPGAVWAGVIMSALCFVALIYCRMRHWDKKKISKCLILLFSAVFAGLLCGINREKGIEGKFPLNEDVEITAELVKYTEKENSVELILKWKGEKITASVYQEELLRNIRKIKPGQKLRVCGVVKTHEKSANPGGFDAESYYRGQGIYLKIEPSYIETVSSEYNKFEYMLLVLRERFSGVYDIILDEKEASVVKAMFLGDKTDIDKTVKKLYQSGGIAHILAISALHVTLIGEGFAGILKRMGAGQKITCIVAVLFIILYGMMTGFAYATIRSVIMLGIGFFARAAGKAQDTPNSLGTALVIMLIINPDSISDAGLQMSFSAVFGVILGNYINKGQSWNAFFKNIVVSISVNLVMSPIILYYYYELPLYGLFINIIVIPLMGTVAASAFISGIIGLISVNIAEITIAPCYVILKLYEIMCSISLKLPCARINIGRPPLWLIIVYYIMLAGLVVLYWRIYLNKGKNPAKRISKGVPVIYISLCILFICMCLKWKNNVFRFVFLDVGQGDGAMIHLPEGVNILVDGGSAYNDGLGEYTLAPALKYYGMADVDYAFISHTDTDHISGILYLLNNKEIMGISIKYLVFSQEAPMQEGYSELENAAKKAGTEIIFVKAGDVFLSDKIEKSGAKIKVLYPGAGISSNVMDKNECSMVFSVECKGKSILFTGDIGSDTEKQLVLKNILTEYDILKVPHHGSKHSSCEEFLDIVNPETAVISCGENNVYGHPSEETLDRLEMRGTEIIRTDKNGACIFEIR